MSDLLLGDGAGGAVGTGDGAAIGTGGAVPSDGLYDLDAFAGAILAMLPHGRVWPRDTDAVLVDTAWRLAPSPHRVVLRAAALLRDSPVGILDERLPDWEATLGLPDPCAGAAPTLVQRQASVAAALAAQGGQSGPYFLAILAALGRTGRVRSVAPCRCGLIRAEDPVYGPDWAHAWQVTVAPALDDGDTVADAVVACVLRRLAPAHAVLIVDFSAQFNPAVFGPTFDISAP